MQIETLLRALSEPTRLRIMRLLSHMEIAVGELALVLEQSQPRVSRHIRILCEAELAERRKEGSWVFLRSMIGEAMADGLGRRASQLLEAAEQEDERFAACCAADLRSLAMIRSAREAKAAAYFERHAAEWDSLRQMHGADEPVEAALLGALGPHPLGRILDIGTGTGRIAELLAPNAEHVTALDKSAEMLRIARARLQDLPPEQLDLVRGDFLELPFDGACFDTVLLHHVLHFAQEPEPVLAEAARVTRISGRIAIVDLATHDREDLRDIHAHARLGFSDAQMEELLIGVGFAPKPAISLPGDSLTVKIWTADRLAQTPREAQAHQQPIESRKAAQS